jgi:RNA polymerase sigma-70 factor (ECF subfamily)
MLKGWNPRHSLEEKLNPDNGMLMACTSEREAIHAAKRGDTHSFETLYNLHRRRVYALCLRMTGNTAEGEDLTQEVFLQLFRKIGTFRGDSAFSTWLHRVAVNVVLMRLRKKPLPNTTEPLELQHDDRPKREIGAPDHTLAFSVDRIALQRSFEHLPPGYRHIFWLHDVEGYQHTEIARMMRCSVGNSKSQLHKARAKLRSHLQTRSETLTGRMRYKHRMAA